MAAMSLDVPAAWTHIEPDTLRGALLIVGAPDTGKSTFARYLYRTLCPLRRTAFLDGDPGQSVLGPPTTMTLTLGQAGRDVWPPHGQTWRRFVGAVSPRRHMLPLLVNAARLTQAAYAAGAEVVVYDTTGLVEPAQGGLNLKVAKIDLVQPSAVFAFQRDQELEGLLAPLRALARQNRIRLFEFQPSAAVQPRDTAARQAHRAAQFARYFQSARALAVDWRSLAVLPSPQFIFQQLVALEDAAGFTQGLGLVELCAVPARQVTLRTPLASLHGSAALRLGDVTVDTRTFRDQPI